MKKAMSTVFLICLIFSSVFSQQIAENTAKRQMETLDRGIVAVRKSPQEVFISWRLLGTEPASTGFNLYRDRRKLNKKPLTQVTNYSDRTSTDGIYTVKTVMKGKEVKPSASCGVWQYNHLKIPLNRPAGGTMEKEVVPVRQGQTNQTAGNPPAGITPAGAITDRLPQNRRQYSYSPGDASVADLDGDGQYEIVLKWDPSNARDNSFWTTLFQNIYQNLHNPAFSTSLMKKIPLSPLSRQSGKLL